MSERFCSLVFGTFLFVIALAIVGPCSADETVGGGLIAHWKFDEGAGDVVKDSSGEGNDGTIVPAKYARAEVGYRGLCRFGLLQRWQRSFCPDSTFSIPQQLEEANHRRGVYLPEDAVDFNQQVYLNGSTQMEKSSPVWPKSCSARCDSEKHRPDLQQGTSRLCNVNGEKQCTPTNTISVTGRKITFFITSGTSA